MFTGGDDELNDDDLDDGKFMVDGVDNELFDPDPDDGGVVGSTGGADKGGGAFNGCGGKMG